MKKLYDHTDVAIVALRLVPFAKLREEDRHVPAVYSVLVPEGTHDRLVRPIAMHAFNRTCPVKELEDFEFVVFNPRTGRVFDEESEHAAVPYLGRHLQCISDAQPSIFTITVTAVGNHDSVELGEVTIVADHADEAREKARDLLWDDRLTCAGCRAEYETSLKHFAPGRNSIDELIAMETDAGMGFRSNDRGIAIVRRAAEGLTPAAKGKITRIINQGTKTERDGTRLIKPVLYEHLADAFAGVQYLLGDAIDAEAEEAAAARATAYSDDQDDEVEFACAPGQS